MFVFFHGRRVLVAFKHHGSPPLGFIGSESMYIGVNIIWFMGKKPQVMTRHII